MTEQEAIYIIKYASAFNKDNSPLTKAMEMAVEALEKQIPMKPITYNETNRADCPICKATVRGIKEPFGDYCSDCGKKIEWE